MTNKRQFARLKRGVGEWNQWRKKNYRIEINLGEANLSEANLSGANLSGANLNSTNLSKANLSGANLNSTNLSKANLSGAKLSGAKLNRANLNEAKLSGADLSGVNLSGADLNEAKLSGVNLSGVNLSGVNLNGVDLSGADLSGADLSETDLFEANLSGADLSETYLSETYLFKANLFEANLSRVNALNTNFTCANLTGACIQDWHINADTTFEEVICDYIYYKIDEEGTYQERRPHDPNKIFNAGDFQRLIETARETVDLIFSDGIDWKAFLASFHGLQIESENGELSIAGILKKRDGTFVIQIDAPQNTNKAELEKRFYEDYEQKVALIEQNYQAQLAIKDQEITHRDQELLQLYRENRMKSTDITEIAKLLAENSNRNTYIITEAKAVANSETNNIEQSGNFGVGVNQGEIQGNPKFAGILNEAEQQNLTEIITEVQAIITPLVQTYPNNPTTQGIKTIEAIEKNPNLKQKLIEAAKKGGLAAFKKSFDNPVGAFIGTAIEVWMGK
jgi:uncharacterized protein YjbI with pentapeptide repeats